MNYKIKPIRGVPDRMYAFREGSEQPLGSFKDYHNGTVYTGSNHPKGEIDIIGLFSQQNTYQKNLIKFILLIDSLKIPNTIFRINFTINNLTEQGFSDFKQALLPKKKTKSKTTRRYYLHGRIKKCKLVRMSPTEKTIYVDNPELTGVKAKMVNMIFELRDNHGYSIQQEIPD